MKTIDFQNMDVQERLQTMEAIWNSLLSEVDRLKSPVWHRDTLEERKKKIQSGKAEFVTLSDLKTDYKA
jgi:hypothetical protein